ncbi:MAG: hypothetical protein JSW10_03725 [Pseudomonadota bacterium]|nr:MAG: hypothetical protein JSW10_03725 [Pseudomonadota bacterium]
MSFCGPFYLPGQALAQEKTARPEHPALLFRLGPRTPEQIAAFYEARGFPAAAIDALNQTCFITVSMRNKSNKVIWLELKNWRLIAASGEIQRLKRSYWQQLWSHLNVPQANRSTFGWTLLPETRDLQPSEPVGGNITLPPTTEPFTLEARFKTGREKRAGEIILRYDNVRCAGREAKQ